jgi:hypothetical protein
MVMWAITPEGRKRARPFRVLPESPQHQRWRDARTLAEQEIERLRTDALVAVEQARDLLENPLEPGLDSDVWLLLGRWLELVMRRMASATYCLREWREPHGRRADLVEPGKIELREPSRWSYVDDVGARAAGLGLRAGASEPPAWR